MEKEIHGWRYKYLSDGNDFHFEITPDSNLPSTDRLFKYQSISDNSIKNLEQGNFYIAEPTDFNDEYDGSIRRLDFNKISLPMCLELINKPDKTIEFINIWKTNPDEIVNLARFHFYQELITRIGILCLTPNPLCELMWGYYSKNEGFCLEFDPLKFPQNFHGPYPVNYVDLKLVPFVDLGKPFSLISLFSHKKSFWKHESEFRFLVTPSNTPGFKTKKPYQKLDCDLFSDRLESYGKALKSITFGYKFMDNELKNDLVVVDISGNFQVQFNSEKDGSKSLKQRLFETIIKKDIPCYNIIQFVDFENINPFSLKRDKWSIKKLSENNFEVTITHKNLD